jgi:methyl-accepting chemotaxis protein
MTEDVFRWVIVLGVALAAIAVVVQAVLVFAMYRVTKTTQDELVEVANAAGPILKSMGRLIEENTPRLSQMMADSAEMVKTLREQVNRLGDVIKDVTDRARAQVARIDGVMDQTIEQVQAASGAVRGAVVMPVKQMDGIMHGIRAALAVLTQGRRESVDHATQDEEMFI